jgi:hypothetical protein
MSIKIPLFGRLPIIPSAICRKSTVSKPEQKAGIAFSNALPAFWSHVFNFSCERESNLDVGVLFFKIIHLVRKRKARRSFVIGRGMPIGIYFCHGLSRWKEGPPHWGISPSCRPRPATLSSRGLIRLWWLERRSGGSDRLFLHEMSVGVIRARRAHRAPDSEGVISSLCLSVMLGPALRSLIHALKLLGTRPLTRPVSRRLLLNSESIESSLYGYYKGKLGKNLLTLFLSLRGKNPLHF